jgi:hypothetical protein
MGSESIRYPIVLGWQRSHEHWQNHWPHSLPNSARLNRRTASSQRAFELGRDWGSETFILSRAGHIKAKSGRSRWEEGFAYLYRLLNRIEQQAHETA